jgi:hypothetical protein
MARDASLMAVDIDLRTDPPAIGTPHRLFMTNHRTRSGAGTDYVPSLDGQRFLVTIPAMNAETPEIIVTLNWPELLRQR